MDLLNSVKKWINPNKKIAKDKKIIGEISEISSIMILTVNKM